MRYLLLCLLLLTFLPAAALPPAPPTLALTPHAPAVLLPGQSFTATLIVTATTPITVGVTVDRDLALLGVTFPEIAILPEPDRVIVPLPSGTTTITLDLRVRETAQPGPAQLLAYSLDPLVRRQVSVVVAYRQLLPALIR